MSATLVIALPLALLGIAALLGFVGCALQTGGVPSAYFNAVSKTGPVSYWELSELSDPREGVTTTAADSAPAAHHFDGTYTQGPDVPTYDAVDQSAAASGNFTQGQSTLVAGDGTCTLFDGGFVQVGFQPLLNPKTFTFEAWVKPNWNVGDPPAIRSVVQSTDAANHRGFGLFVGTDNFWAASVGNGTTFTETMPVAGSQPVDPSQGKPVYLAMTYDGTTLSLFVNAQLYGKNTEPNFVPVSAAAPMGLFIASGMTPTKALFPFSGFIQDVALYNGALDPNTITEHGLVGTVG